MNSLKILIADDHEIFRRNLRSLLELRSDWQVCGEAADGNEAVEKAKALLPDVILMDVAMPRMDGVKATRIIKQEIPQATVIIVSQNDADIVSRQATEAGAGGYVTKNNIARDLLPLIEKAMSRDGSGEASASVTQKQAETKPAAAHSFPPDLDYLSQSGEMAKRLRSFDWSQTSLGPIEYWPQSLKTSVSICLASRFPIVMYWGPQYVVLYNDAYSTILGNKHPWALGQRCRDCWAEIWETIGPMLDEVVNSGRATWSDDFLLLLQRRSYPEECYFSFSFSPVRVETGFVGGVFTAVMETTDKVIGERRLRTLRDLASGAVEAKSEKDAWSIAAATLARNLHDLPFSILCKVDEAEGGTQILATAGIEKNHTFLSALCAPGSRLYDEVRRAAQSKETREVKDLSEWSDELPRGAWKVAAQSLIVLPIADIGPEKSSDVLLATVSPHKKLDEGYRTFFQLVAHQIASSVAEARAHEEERKRAQALVELDRAKTLFFSNVSHEFRTPLTLMLGPLEDTLANSAAFPAEDRARLEVVHRNSLRLLKLVNTLLDFSRIEAGRIQAAYEATNLAQFTSELASMFQSAVERTGMRFVIDCPALPEMVYVDHEMWEKIIFNLLSNAFKFTFEGEIRVSLRAVGTSVEMTVRDTGTGIPAEEIPRLFERFHRVSGARGRSYEGSGIGLALVQELVKLHGGIVSIESEVNRGSAFTVTVPFGKDHLPADRIGGTRTMASTALRGHVYVEELMGWIPDGHRIQADDISVSPLGLQPETGSQAKSRQRARILLADDNADMRDYVQHLLRNEYEVIAVADGQAALASAREHRPDLILSDIMMPKLDGFGLLREVRADHNLKDVPVIMLSARAGEEARVEGLGSGADDYLVKPFSARELMTRVSSHLAIARIRGESAKIERALRLDAEKLASIVASSDDAIVSKDLNGVIVSWNRGAERIFGYTPEEAIGQNIAIIIPPDRQHEETEILKRIRAGDKIDHFETVRVRKDGTRLDISVTISPLKDSAGTVIGASKVARDITKQKQSEVALQESEERLRALVNASSYAVYRMSPDWKEMRQLHGNGFISDTAKPNRNWMNEYVHPEDQLKVQHAIEAAIQTKELFELEHRVWQPNGSVGWTLSRAVPVFDEHGNIIEWFGAASDVTRRKQAEESYRKLASTLDTEVRARTKDLENRNADILRQSEQLRDLSHRLLQAQDEERRRIARELHDSAGQTLTVLSLSLAELVHNASSSAPSLTADAEQIEETVRQLNREIRTASYLLHPPLLDETGVSSALAWYVQGLVERSRLEVELDIPRDFGRLPHDMELVIFRLVQECLTNIHRHSDSKTAAIRINREKNHVIVNVRDTGKGMSPARLAEIQSQGSGVGIRGIRERLRQFHGKLFIESDASGTRISAVIPIPEQEEKGIGPMPAAV